MKNKVKKYNIIRTIEVFIISIIITVFIFLKNVINIDDILLGGDDFHYNIITMSATIAGFLFTGIGILISTISNERIKRLWENDYLDKLYYAGFIGIVSNIISIILAFIIVICRINSNVTSILIYVEILTIICGITYFLWCVKTLIFVISRLKN